MKRVPIGERCTLPRIREVVVNMLFVEDCGAGSVQREHAAQGAAVLDCLVNDLLHRFLEDDVVAVWR